RMGGAGRQAAPGGNRLRDRTPCPVQGRSRRTGYYVLYGPFGQCARVQGIWRPQPGVREIGRLGSARPGRGRFSRKRCMLLSSRVLLGCAAPMGAAGVMLAAMATHLSGGGLLSTAALFLLLHAAAVAGLAAMAPHLQRG